MHPERKDKIVSVLNMIREDIPADVERREGLPFTAETVATALGEMCAQIDALAAIMLEIVNDEPPATTEH